MKIAEIIQAAKQGNEVAFGNVPEKRVSAIVRAVLGQLNKQVREAHEGQVVLPGFGKFIVREKEVEKDGQKVTQRRVAFRAAPPKSAGAGTAEKPRKPAKAAE